MLALQQEMAAMRTTFQQELAAQRTALTVSEARNIPNPRGRGGGGRGGGGRGGRGRGGRGIGRRPPGILGAFSELDKRLTRYDDGRTTKMYGNQNDYHTHGWDKTPSHDSTNCSYPRTSFTTSQQLPTTPRMDATCTNVSPTKPEGVGSMTNRTII